MINKINKDKKSWIQNNEYYRFLTQTLNFVRLQSVFELHICM